MKPESHMQKVNQIQIFKLLMFICSFFLAKRCFPKGKKSQWKTWMSGYNKIVTINHLYIWEESRLRTYEVSLYLRVCLTSRSNLGVWSYSPVWIRHPGKFCFPRRAGSPSSLSLLHQKGTMNPHGAGVRVLSREWGSPTLLRDLFISHAQDRWGSESSSFLWIGGLHIVPSDSDQCDFSRKAGASSCRVLRGINVIFLKGLGFCIWTFLATIFGATAFSNLGHQDGAERQASLRPEPKPAAQASGLQLSHLLFHKDTSEKGLWVTEWPRAGTPLTHSGHASWVHFTPEIGQHV